MLVGYISLIAIGVVATGAILQQQLTRNRGTRWWQLQPLRTGLLTAPVKNCFLNLAYFTYLYLNLLKFYVGLLTSLIYSLSNDKIIQIIQDISC